MKIYQRLKTIWKLGEIKILPNGVYETPPEYKVESKNSTIEIIKRLTPEEEFLQNNATK